MYVPKYYLVQYCLTKYEQNKKLIVSFFFILTLKKAKIKRNIQYFSSFTQKYIELELTHIDSSTRFLIASFRKTFFSLQIKFHC